MFSTAPVHFEDSAETASGVAFRRRIDEYGEYLASIGQEQVLDIIAEKLSEIGATATLDLAGSPLQGRK